MKTLNHLSASVALSLILGFWGAFLENQLTYSGMTDFRLGHWAWAGIILLLAVIYDFKSSLWAWLIFFFSIGQALVIAKWSVIWWIGWSLSQ